MLTMRELSRVYRTETVETCALDGVHLDIEEGEFVAVMGPSGCGKSTLLNVMGMLDSLTSGSICSWPPAPVGKSEAELATIRKKNIGFIFQSLQPGRRNLPVRENTELAPCTMTCPPAAALAGGRSRGQGRHRAPRQAPAEPAVGRPAAAVLRSLERLLAAQADPRRRADRQPRHAARRRGREDAPGAQPRGLDHRHGHHSPAHADYAGRVVNMLDGRVLQEWRKPLRHGGERIEKDRSGKRDGAMWRNYLTVGLRALTKNKTYAFINIVGLAIGLARPPDPPALRALRNLIRPAMVADADRVYQGAGDQHRSGKCRQPAPAGRAHGVVARPLAQAFPEIEVATRAEGTA